MREHLHDAGIRGFRPAIGVMEKAARGRSIVDSTA
jgi:hypothetical protein